MEGQDGEGEDEISVVREHIEDQRYPISTTACNSRSRYVKFHFLCR